jgi:hypothetical protein
MTPSSSRDYLTNAAACGGKQVVKSSCYLQTDPRQFDILQSGPGWWGTECNPIIETSRVLHAARRRSRVAARGGRSKGTCMGSKSESSSSRHSPVSGRAVLIRTHPVKLWIAWQRKNWRLALIVLRSGPKAR